MVPDVGRRQYPHIGSEAQCHGIEGIPHGPADIGPDAPVREPGELVVGE